MQWERGSQIVRHVAPKQNESHYTFPAELMAVRTITCTWPAISNHWEVVAINAPKSSMSVYFNYFGTVDYFESTWNHRTEAAISRRALLCFGSSRFLWFSPVSPCWTCSSESFARHKQDITRAREPGPIFLVQVWPLPSLEADIWRFWCSMMWDDIWDTCWYLSNMMMYNDMIIPYAISSYLIHDD